MADRLFSLGPRSTRDRQCAATAAIRLFGPLEEPGEQCLEVVGIEHAVEQGA